MSYDIKIKNKYTRQLSEHENSDDSDSDSDSLEFSNGYCYGYNTYVTKPNLCNIQYFSQYNQDRYTRNIHHENDLYDPIEAFIDLIDN